ncbi:MAG: SHOCT domain-containing protein [Bilifractor sp.]
MEEEMTVTKYTGREKAEALAARSFTQEELRSEYAYSLATKKLMMLYEAGLISKGEFNKIDRKNRESFSPHLAAIMPELR